MTTDAVTRIGPGEFAARRDEIAALDARVRTAEGHEALGDAAWRDLAHPRPDSAGFLLYGRAYAHVARGERPDDTNWTAALAQPPDGRDPATTRALLDAAVAHAAQHHGRTITSWVFGAGEADDAAFAEAGFRLDRSLFEMRVPLPLDATARPPAGISIRTFERGRDDAAWLHVNNVAFAAHAEQGGWSEETLRGRIAEAWFDPSLFLVAVDASGLAGFNWLKWHDATGVDPAMGEIYVIGVDPRAQGSGLGRALAVDGLRLLHERGAKVGMLFVGADNTGALVLYRSLGFTVHRTDRAYVRTIDETSRPA